MKHIFWEITHNNSKDNKAVSWMLKIDLPREDNSCARGENSAIQLDFKKTYVDSKKTFYVDFCSILINEMRTGQISTQFENCLDCWAQSLANSSSSCTWCSLWSTAAHGLMLGLLLFVLHCICHDIKWRRLLDTPNCSFNAQAPLETWGPFSVSLTLSNLPKCT